MSLSTTDFEYVRDLVDVEAGIVLDDAKRYLVESRLQPVARIEGFDSPGALVAQARQSSRTALRATIVEAMTTNETSFFRDVEPFEALRLHVLPALIARRRVARRLRIWCGASSTGQEPYSLVMLMLEHFPELATWDVEFLATDLSQDVLKKAASGHFSRIEVNRGLPATLLTRYFDKAGTEWVIKDVVRKAVSFRSMNLIKPWPPMGPFDLVMLRNVMIYFDVATKKQILDRILRALAPDGYLFLGSVETTMGIHDGFDRQTSGRTGFYRPAGALQKHGA
ncbi:MAG: protein-glutamate O-methyltransferase CheR [Acidobacteria bacterium]|nr:protein-glutamate O-methyltransferase CheR [Acidobacteriota bacterium]